MRLAIVRVWAALATALLAAAVADAGTEFAENLGWLGKTMRDGHQESVLPTFLLGLAIGLALAAFVAFARIGPQDPLIRCFNAWRARAVDLSLALGGSALCTIAMEGYETRLGGLSPFDPRSVVQSHAVALIVALVVVAAVVRMVMGAALRVASQAGELATSVLVEFLRKIRRVQARPGSIRTSAFTLHVLHLPPALSVGARGLRAPPRSALLQHITT